MNEIMFRDWLMAKSCETEHEDYILKEVYTFQDVGMLTRNKGLVFKMKDGSKFQVTIVQSEFSD